MDVQLNEDVESQDLIILDDLENEEFHARSSADSSKMSGKKRKRDRRTHLDQQTIISKLSKMGGNCCQYANEQTNCILVNFFDDENGLFDFNHAFQFIQHFRKKTCGLDSEDLRTFMRAR
jgi:hypothetical protein